MNKLSIEEYAEKFPHFYDIKIPSLLVQTIKSYSGDNGTMLDVGCGDGTLFYSLSIRKMLENYKYIGVDLSTTRIHNCNETFKSGQFLVSSAETLDGIADESIDIFVSTQVIEHVNDDLFLKSMRRVLKPHGIIYLSTVHKTPYAWYFYRNQNGESVLDPTHLREYTSDLELLGKDDFKYLEIVENKKTLFWFSIAPFLLRKWMQPRPEFAQSNVYKILSFIKIPIVGFYNWELVLKLK